MQGKKKTNNRMFVVRDACLVNKVRYCFGVKRSKLQVTCVRGVYLFFCACLQKVAEKNTESFYKAFGHACTRFNPF